VPYFGSACHGGIVPSATLLAIALAHGRESLNVSSDIGAMSPGRWQLVQFAKKIGAMFLLNVGAAVCADACGATYKALNAMSAGTTSLFIKESSATMPD
jgi:hypothetical protein